MKLYYDSKNQLGECVLWCEKNQSLFWVDIVGRKLCQLTVPEQVYTSWDMTDALGCIALTEDKDVLLLGLAKQLAFFSLSHQTITFICEVEPNLLTTRINDGRCDRQGRFVFGTLNLHPDREKLGSFYRLNQELVLERLPIMSISIANSICFSPDGKRMYFCDSLDKKIYCCDYETGTESEFIPDVFSDLSDYPGVPDGSTVDANGHIWNAAWGAGVVRQYNEEGQMIQQVDLPVSLPTCLSFGGADLDILFVTSAKDELSLRQLEMQQAAGGLFHHDIGISGLQEQRFHLNLNNQIFGKC